MNIKEIGVIHTPFTQPEGAPIQSVFAEGAQGTVEVNPDYVEGLKDLSGFERIWLIYHLDQCARPRNKVIPFRDTQERGIFATRAPCRPNPIGLSCVRLLGIAGPVLSVQDVDMLDGTPLLDIKPYVPRFDSFPTCRAGWIDQARVQQTKADARFGGKEKS